MAGGARDDEDLIAAINVTPLVDVVLVLLIILMVTATAIVSKTIPMELPNADSGEGTPQTRTIAISIDEHGAMYVDRDPIANLEALRARVRSVHEQAPEVRAIIAADGRVPHANVVRVIDALRLEQVTKFAINVRPSDLQQR